MTRRVAYVSLGQWDTWHKRTNPITIYAYHSIAKDRWRFSLDPSEFIKQMKELTSWAHPIRLSDVQAYLHNKLILKRPVFVITFDDGYEDILSVTPILKKLHIYPTVFALASPSDANRQTLGTNKPLLNAQSLKQLVSLGWEIGCHSATHRQLTKVPDEDLQAEIKTAKQMLEKQVGIPVSYFAYPKGTYNQRVIDAVKAAGYKLAASMDDGQITRDSNRWRLPRVGVDRSHSFAEFKHVAAPSVIAFRNLIKQSYFGRYL